MNKYLKTYTAHFLLLYGCSSNSSSSFQKAGALDEAERLYFQMKPDQAYELYEDVWLDSSYTDEDRAKAGRNMARMSWLLYNESAKSFELLRALNSLEIDKDQAHVLSQGYSPHKRNLKKPFQRDGQQFPLLNPIAENMKLR